MKQMQCATPQVLMSLLLGILMLGCRPATKMSTGSDDPSASGERADSETEYVEFEAAPVLISMDPPRYPMEARNAGVEGEVITRVLVGDDGRVKDAVIVQSVPGLDESALEAARTAVFKPAIQKGRPVAVWLFIPLEYDLH